MSQRYFKSQSTEDINCRQGFEGEMTLICIEQSGDVTRSRCRMGGGEAQDGQCGGMALKLSCRVKESGKWPNYSIKWREERDGNLPGNEDGVFHPECLEKEPAVTPPPQQLGRGAGERQKQSGDIRQTPSDVHGLLECPRLAELFWESELPYLPKTSRLVF